MLNYFFLVANMPSAICNHKCVYLYQYKSVFLAKNMQFRGKRYALHGIMECSARHSLLLSKVQKNRLKFVSRQT